MIIRFFVVVVFLRLTTLYCVQGFFSSWNRHCIPFFLTDYTHNGHPNRRVSNYFVIFLDRYWNYLHEISKGGGSTWRTLYSSGLWPDNVGCPPVQSKTPEPPPVAAPSPEWSPSQSQLATGLHFSSSPLSIETQPSTEVQAALPQIYGNWRGSVNVAGKWWY